MDEAIDIVKRFKEAFHDEQLAELCDVMDRLGKAWSGGKPVMDELRALFDGFEQLLTIHGDTLQEWLAEEPEAVDTFELAVKVLRRIQRAIKESRPRDAV
jgi:hypothetical protein